MATITLVKPEREETHRAVRGGPTLAAHKPFVNSTLFYRAREKEKGHFVGYFSGGYQPSENITFEVLSTI